MHSLCVLLHLVIYDVILRSDFVKERMLQSLFGRNTFGVVKFEHSVQQIEGLCVIEFADVSPGDLVLLHFVWNQAAVAILERNLFY